MTLNQALISATTLSTTAASVTIPVPSGYTDLRLVVSGRTTRNNTDPGSDVGITFNGSSSGYYTKALNADGSSAGNGSSSNASYITGTLVNSSYATANTFGVIEAYIPNYASSSKKSVSIETITETNAATAFMRLIAAHWDNTAAITSITLTETNGFSFVAGSTFTLYGVTKLGVTPTLTPKATGGDIVKNDGTYWYHAFLSTGAFIPQTSLTADVLVVAGGGGSYTSPGGGGVGGGGAGGWKAFTSQSLSATSYICTVGAGGVDSNGSNSIFGSLDPAIGGGRGGVADTIGSSGGSGGGTGFRTPSSGTAAGTAGQGNAGGNTSGSYPNFNSGGGGGAGAAGGTGGTNGGAGGIGINTYSSWATATGTGDSGYYAGGGGGMVWYSSGSPGTGGTGGGGTGASTSTNTGSSGLANTGGGAGGSAQTASAGGSGIVIVRYAMA